MLPALAGATAAKVLESFLKMLFVKFPLGGRENHGNEQQYLCAAPL
jgi:hypothetical protein